jgi:hypothetical protein
VVFAKANEDIEAASELLGEVGGSHTSDCTLANSGRGCNRIAKLLKRLIVIRRIVPPSQHPCVTPIPVGLTKIEIYSSIVQRNPTVQPTARRSSFREQQLCQERGQDTPFRELDEARPRHW